MIWVSPLLIYQVGGWDLRPQVQGSSTSALRTLRAGECSVLRVVLGGAGRWQHPQPLPTRCRQKSPPLSYGNRNSLPTYAPGNKSSLLANHRRRVTKRTK